VKICYLFSSEYYERKMSVGRRAYGEALRQFANVTFWGPGWPGYDSNKSLTDNLRGQRFDWLWCYKANHVLGADQTGIPTFVCFNEANDHQATQEEIDGCRASLVVFHHWTDYQIWRSEPIRAVHLPHAAHPLCYLQRTPWHDRPYDLIVSGVQSEEIYPLRWRLREIALTSRWKVLDFPYPGHRLSHSGAIDRQFERYCQALGSARLSVVCSSRYGYGLAKWIESAACGTIPVGDVPADFSPTLGQYCVDIDPEDPDDRIRDSIGKALELTPAWQQGLIRAAEGLSMDVYAKRLAEILEFS